MFCFCSSLWRIFITLQLRYLFDVVTSFDNVRITLYFGTFELRLEITLQLCYVFARHCDVILLRQNDVVLLHHNYVIYLFDVVTFFDITLYFGTFELRMEIMLQLRFVLARHCDVFFITSQFRYLFVRCSYVLWWRYNYVIFYYVRITYWNYVIKWPFFSYVCL